MDKNNREETYLARNIKILEKKYGFTHKMLAEKSNVSVETIKTLCRRNKNYLPTADVAIRIADVFELSCYEDLFQANVDMLAADMDLAADWIGANKQKEINTQQKFRQTMIENGYSSVAAMMDYLMFIGYEVVFIFTGKSLSKKALNDVKDEFLQKSYDAEIRASKALSARVKKSRELKKVQNEFENVKDKNKREEYIIRLEKTSQEYFEKVLNDMQEKYNKKSYGNFKKAVVQKVGMEEVLEIINTLASLPTRIREKRLEELPIDVVVAENGNIYEQKCMRFFKFYIMCISTENYISDMINQGLPD